MGAPRLRYEHVRTLLQLVGESHELAGDPAAQARHLLDRMRSIMHATIVAHCHIDDFWSGGQGDLVQANCVSSGASDHRGCLAYYGDHGTASDPFAARISEVYTAGATLAVRRKDILDNQTWHRSPFYNEVHVPAHIGDVLYSVRSRGQPRKISAVGLIRGTGDRPFDDDERAFIQVFHAEVFSKLERSEHGSPSARVNAHRLPPREHETLRCLLGGMSEKQVATHLGLSQHTIHHYVKSLYRRMGISSRSELLARYIDPTKAQ